MVGLLAAAGLLLIVSGVTKLRAPEAARAALRASHLRMPPLPARGLVRLVGLAQVVAGATALLLDRRIAGLAVCISFSALAAFSWRMAAVAPEQGCGCFGTSDGPVRPGHIAADIAIAVIGAAAALQPGPGFAHELTRQPLWGVPLLALTVILARACFLLMSVLPDLSVARIASGGTR